MRRVVVRLNCLIQSQEIVKELGPIGPNITTESQARSVAEIGVGPIISRNFINFDEAVTSRAAHSRNLRRVAPRRQRD